MYRQDTARFTLGNVVVCRALRVHVEWVALVALHPNHVKQGKDKLMSKNA